jgi:hypothetical protein
MAKVTARQFKAGMAAAYLSCSAGRDQSTFPLKELGRMILPRAGFKSAVKHETGWASVDAVYRGLDSEVAKRVLRLTKENKPDAVYAYEDGALQSFRAARQQGIRCIYDLPIGYWRAARVMLGAERERWPDWAPTLTGLRDSEAKLARKGRGDKTGR